QENFMSREYCMRIAFATAMFGYLSAAIAQQSPASPQAPSKFPSLNMDVVDPSTKALPNPNPTVIKNWGELPNGRVWGSTAGVDIDPIDGNVWAYDRCGANTCEGSTVDPVFKFDRKTGKMLKSFGGGMIVFPHGIHIDKQGNVWITDGQASKDGT